MDDRHPASAYITVIGRDRVGIIADVSRLLADANVNILDISQTVLGDSFTMIMAVDHTKATLDIKALADRLETRGREMDLSILVQHAGIFDAMHRI